MSWPPPLAAWLAKVASLEVVFSGDVTKDAVANTLVFPVKDAQLASVPIADLNRFLLEVFRAISRKLDPKRNRAWFYAWYDEMSGTLRCSIASVEGPWDLPFACRLDVLDVPSRVSEAALTSRYASGIPAEELRDDEWRDEEDDESEFVLSVFARPVIARV